MDSWNYEPPKNLQAASQEDWNSTIVTAFNCVVSGNNLNKLGEKIDILVPNKFKNLIESLFFYENGVIANRYNVDFIDDNSNLIFIGGCELEILNFKQ
jgi:hypothetical protein